MGTFDRKRPRWLDRVRPAASDGVCAHLRQRRRPTCSQRHGRARDIENLSAPDSDRFQVKAVHSPADHDTKPAQIAERD